MGEKYRLRMFVSSVLRNLSEPKTERVTGEWRQVYNEKLSRSVLLVNVIGED
jgi:hypothetical protein